MGSAPLYCSFTIGRLHRLAPIGQTKIQNSGQPVWRIVLRFLFIWIIYLFIFVFICMCVCFSYCTAHALVQVLSLLKGTLLCVKHGCFKEFVHPVWIMHVLFCYDQLGVNYS